MSTTKKKVYKKKSPPPASYASILSKTHDESGDVSGDDNECDEQNTFSTKNSFENSSIDTWEYTYFGYI